MWRSWMYLGIGLFMVACGCRAPSAGGTSDAHVPEASESVRWVDGPAVRALVHASDAPAAVVLNFWATWCEPCKEEFPMLAKMKRVYGGEGEENSGVDRGVRLYFISMDFPEEVPAAEAFLRASGVELPGYVRKGKDHEFINSVHPEWSGALPATLVYGPNKELRYFWEGKLTEASITEALDALVAEASSTKR